METDAPTSEPEYVRRRRDAEGVRPIVDDEEGTWVDRPDATGQPAWLSQLRYLARARRWRLLRRAHRSWRDSR